MKKCFKCKVSKELNEFYVHKQMKDGHLNKCKLCARNDSRKHRSLNIEKIRNYDRSRGNRQSIEYIKNYKERYPKKYKAKIITNNAVRDGKITKLYYCTECRVENKRIYGHHDDYNKPLEVRWLCQACHKQWHAKNGEAKNAS